VGGKISPQELENSLFHQQPWNDIGPDGPAAVLAVAKGGAFDFPLDGIAVQTAIASHLA
jgi:hypothetical protein